MKHVTSKNITLLAAGTRGDVQPFVALGRALKRAGYGVRPKATRSVFLVV